MKCLHALSTTTLGRQPACAVPIGQSASSRGAHVQPLGPGLPVSAVLLATCVPTKCSLAFSATSPSSPSFSGLLTGLTAYCLETAFPLAQSRLVRLRLHEAAENLQALSTLLRAEPLRVHFSRT